jgi:hypothetical protein
MSWQVKPPWRTRSRSSHNRMLFTARERSSKNVERLSKPCRRCRRIRTCSTRRCEVAYLSIVVAVTGESVLTAAGCSVHNSCALQVGSNHGLHDRTHFIYSQTHEFVKLRIYLLLCQCQASGESGRSVNNNCALGVGSNPRLAPFFYRLKYITTHFERTLRCW